MMSTLFRSSSGAGGWFPRIPRLSSHSSSTSSSKSLSLGESLSELFPPLTPTSQSTPCQEPATPGGQYRQAPHKQQSGGACPTNKTESFKENLTLEKNSDSLELVCVTMKQQIISRAFYGWLAHCRHLRTVRTHLAGLVLPVSAAPTLLPEWREGVTEGMWKELTKLGTVAGESEVWGRVYLGGVQHSIRREVWPYLLGQYSFSSTEQSRAAADIKTRANYESLMSEWLAVEAIIRQRNKEVMAQNLARLMSESQSPGSKEGATRTPSEQATTPQTPVVTRARTLSNEVFEPDTISFDSADSDNSKLLSKDNTDPSSSLTQDIVGIREDRPCEGKSGKLPKESTSTLTPSEHRSLDLSSSPTKASADRIDGTCSAVASKLELSTCTDQREDAEEGSVGGRKTASKDSSVDEMFSPACIVTPDGTTEDLRGAASSATTHDDTQSYMSAVSDDAGVDDTAADGDDVLTDDATLADGVRGEAGKDKLAVDDAMDGHSVDSRSSCMSPSSSHCGGVYSMELLEEFGLNLHRIDNDVQRCDRNYYYFTPANLEKLRNVMCTYVWEHLSTGYLQGMCDLAAPLLVVFDDEALTYSCFQHLMVRMTANFPHGGQMDQHFANMRSLIQILDSEMFELMQNKGDYSHFYFCYRWFLLDFKRELVYDDVFVAWETIWSAQHVSSPHFFLFLALALVEHYRDIILDNNMDFTDIIKFFNEMAEHHDAKAVLRTARNLVTQLQTLIENK